MLSIGRKVVGRRCESDAPRGLLALRSVGDRAALGVAELELGRDRGAAGRGRVRHVLGRLAKDRQHLGVPAVAGEAAMSAEGTDPDPETRERASDRLVAFACRLTRSAEENGESPDALICVRQLRTPRVGGWRRR